MNCQHLSGMSKEAKCSGLENGQRTYVCVEHGNMDDGESTQGERGRELKQKHAIGTREISKNSTDFSVIAAPLAVVRISS